MALYHGTLAGLEILKDGFIHPTSRENSVYGINEESESGLSLQTSEGYVYLALKEAKAWEFAYSAMVHHGKALTGTAVYLFEVDALGLKWHPDYDEYGSKDVSLSEAVKETETCAIKGSLKLGERVKRYKKIEIKDYHELACLMDSGQLEKMKWIEI